MRLVLWIKDSPQHRALAAKIQERFGAALIVAEQPGRKKFKFSNFSSKVGDALFYAPIRKAWSRMLSHYKTKFPAWPPTKILFTPHINSEEVHKATLDAKPDLIVVSGTSIIRPKLLSIRPSIGILNLHTGLSPYLNGGPNCTNWCLANGQFHLIGNTVMWIDEGIDTGNIIVTELTELRGDESLEQLHLSVMEHAHALYLKAIEKVLDNYRFSVPQKELGPGKTYFTKDWGNKEKKALLKNFKRFKSVIGSGEYKTLRGKVKTVSFKNG